MASRVIQKKSIKNVGRRIAAAVLLTSLIPATGLSDSDRGVLFQPAVLEQAFQNPSDIKEPRSPFDSLIRKYARKYSQDWRLILAIVDTESKFLEQATSPKGAKGLMQIMPVIVKSNNVSSAYHPEQNLAAGVRHFGWLRRKIKGATAQDQLKLAIAAYNSGLAHLRDAQTLAMNAGLSSRKWKDVSKMYLLLEQKEFSMKAKHGFCKGSETISYVGKVIGNYEKYRTSFPKNTVFLTQAPSRSKRTTV